MARRRTRKRCIRCEYWRSDGSVENAEKDLLDFGLLTVVIERWTNNRYRSTMHRVISPLYDRDRYSSAFFNEGPLDRIIECIPTCLKPGEEPLYRPIKIEDHLMERYRQSYA